MNFGLPPPSRIEHDSSASFACWARFTDTVALDKFIVIDTNGGAAAIVFLVYWWSSGNGMIARSGISNTQTSDLDIDPDITKLHHWVFTKPASNGVRPKIYIDGVRHDVSSGSSLSNNDVSSIRIGQDAATGGSFDFDDAILWDRELKAEEVLELYRLPRGALLRGKIDVSAFGTRTAASETNPSLAVVRG